MQAQRTLINLTKKTTTNVSPNKDTESINSTTVTTSCNHIPVKIKSVNGNGTYSMTMGLLTDSKFQIIVGGEVLLLVANSITQDSHRLISRADC